MERRAFLKASAGGAALTVSAPYVSLNAAPLTLRWAHFAQEDHPANTAAKQFASRVEARTGGGSKINIFSHKVLGGPPPQAPPNKLRPIHKCLPPPRPVGKKKTPLSAGEPALPFPQPP